MSEHVILGATAIVGFTMQIAGLVWMHRMLRESQRMTRAVAGLVYQESDKLRALFSDK